jgi:hypothetical protein
MTEERYKLHCLAQIFAVVLTSFKFGPAATFATSLDSNSDMLSSNLLSGNKYRSKITREQVRTRGSRNNHLKHLSPAI